MQQFHFQEPLNDVANGAIIREANSLCSADEAAKAAKSKSQGMNLSLVLFGPQVGASVPSAPT